MESALFSINNLKMMEVIDINSAMRLGYIRDIKIDCNEYKIISIIIPVQKNSWFSKVEAIEIPWSKIRKVGVDVILVENDAEEMNEE